MANYLVLNDFQGQTTQGAAILRTGQTISDGEYSIAALRGAGAVVTPKTAGMDAVVAEFMAQRLVQGASANYTLIALLLVAGFFGDGAGDIVGPGSAVAGNLVAFSGTSGKLVADSGSSVAALAAATAAALVVANAAVPATQKGAALGVATLDAGGLIPTAQLPPLAITQAFPVASEVAMLALTAEIGDVAIRSDLNKSFILAASPASTLINWLELLTPTNAVLSVFGRTGVVVAADADYTSSQVVNGSGVAGARVSNALDTLAAAIAALAPANYYGVYGSKPAGVSGQRANYSDAFVGQVHDGTAWRNDIDGKLMPVPPLVAAYTLVRNAGGLTFSDTQNTTLIARASGSGLDVYDFTGATGLTARVKFKPGPSGSGAIGVCLRESGTGKIAILKVALGATSGQALSVARWTNPTTFGTNGTSLACVGDVPEIRIRYAAPNVIYEYTIDGGATWNVIQSEAATTPFTTAPDRAGLIFEGVQTPSEILSAAFT